MIYREIPSPAGQVTVCLVGSDADFAGNSHHETYRKISSFCGNEISLCYAEQVHGDTLLQIDGAESRIFSAGEGDALVTQQAKTALLVRTADCIPILFWSEKTKLVGAVHAGWRGLQKKILTKTLAAVTSAGHGVQDLSFVVGPFIGSASYEVGDEVAAQFNSAASRSQENGKYLLDLGHILKAEFAALQVADAQITWFAEDTFTSAQWYSARRGHTSRNMALIFRR